MKYKPEDYLNYHDVSICCSPADTRLEDIHLSTGPVVQLESPFSPSNGYPLESNLRYARAALRDSILRGEMPFASHLLYTQEGVLDDNNPLERKIGIETGFKGLRTGYIGKSVVYADYGLSSGMIQGIRVAFEENCHVQFRYIERDFGVYDAMDELRNLMRKIAYG